MGSDNANATAHSRAGGRIDDIEVLRAFAIGLVLVHHSVILFPFGSGAEGPLFTNLGFWPGVDLFLVISGFVIARSLLPLLPPATEPLAFFNMSLSFWVRRAWRLLPSAWLWLAIPIAASVAFNRSGAFGSFQANVEGAITAVLNLANFHFAYAFGRYDTGAVFHYWSLSLEEQFYFVLPFLIFFTRRRLPLALALLVAAQFFVKRQGPWGHLLLGAIRSDGLALGVLLAIWSRSAGYTRLEPVVFKPWLARMLLPPAFLLVYILAGAPMFGLPPFTVGLIAFLGAAIVWVASYDGDYLFPPGRLKRLICWVGGRSYGMYLIHVPVYLATQEFWFRVAPGVLQPSPRHVALMVATSLPVVCILAELNFRFVEDPLRRRGARIAESIRLRDPSFATMEHKAA
jgi:peptidoglycan/LPS O-acetylase OafA/YrhL